MKYEYKSVLLENYVNECFDEKHCDILNDYFKLGWEYVDSISQTIAQGSDLTEYGAVIVILKKEKEEVTL